MADKPPVALEERDERADGRRFSPSVARNRDPILNVLLKVLPGKKNVLEIASGTGEHGVWFAAHMADLAWTYSDIDPDSLRSQAAWQRICAYEPLQGPLTIDASADNWGAAEIAGHWDAIFSANMVHIAPFAAAEGLFRGAGRLLPVGGQLILYGPFARGGDIAASNAAFSNSLKDRNADWGVRDLDAELVPLANNAGLELQAVLEMPANNLIAVFQKL